MCWSSDYLFMLFMAIMITGQMIASEITAEKSSRVMEILITSVSPLKADVRQNHRYVPYCNQRKSLYTSSSLL